MEEHKFHSLHSEDYDHDNYILRCPYDKTERKVTCHLLLWNAEYLAFSSYVNNLFPDS